MMVKPITHCPFCDVKLSIYEKRQRIFLWSDCDNTKCESQFMQYSYLKKDCAILWKFNLKIQSDLIKIDLHFPVKENFSCGIFGYKKDKNGSSNVVFELDCMMDSDLLLIDNLKKKIENLILFA